MVIWFSVKYGFLIWKKQYESIVHLSFTRNENRILIGNFFAKISHGISAMIFDVIKNKQLPLSSIKLWLKSIVRSAGLLLVITDTANLWTKSDLQGEKKVKIRLIRGRLIVIINNSIVFVWLLILWKNRFFLINNFYYINIDYNRN